MSKELTEKLKQGNLKDGYYYAKMPTGCVDVVSLYNLRQLRLAKDGDKIEVLDIVPDYIQYQNICKGLSEERRGNSNLLEENEKLKKLIAKSYDFIARYQVDGAEPTDAENIKFLSEIEMLLNPENVTENVANQKVQHCEKRIDE